MAGATRRFYLTGVCVVIGGARVLREEGGEGDGGVVEAVGNELPPPPPGSFEEEKVEGGKWGKKKQGVEENW